MQPTFRRTAVAAILGSALAMPAAMAHAQDRQQKGGTQPPGAELLDWNVADLYRSGWSAEEMLDKPVPSASGEQIGEVEDIIVDRNGNVSKVVVEVGGFVELGDQHIGVPWKDVKIGEGMEFVQVPLQQVENGTYSLFGKTPQGEDVAAAQASWRVNELLGDYASLWDVPRYGIVDDVIFNASGEALALVVDRAAGVWGGYGPYAYPWLGYYPGRYAYPLPYRSEAVVALQSFDYAQLGEQSRYSGADSNASAGSTRRQGTGLTAKQSEAHGSYLADARGRAVYLLETDAKGESHCYDACAKTWPPLLAPKGTPAAADKSVQQDLIGTLERPDGSMQVTYNGHPLYYYVKDQGAGKATGQDVHDKWGEWYLVAPSGAKVGE